MQSSDFPLQNRSYKSNFGIFLSRFIRAIKLDADLYEEVEVDRTATFQSILIIILSGIAAGLGGIESPSVIQVLLNVVATLGGWLLWAYITFLIGTKLLPEPQTVASYGEMIRTIGFASSPGLFRILGVIPVIGPIIFIAADMWMIIAMVVAIKQALDYQSWFRPVIVSILGWLIQILILLSISLLIVR